MDNRSAGQTAAYLLGQWLGAQTRAGVLVSLSSTRFRGEEEREAGFAQALREHYPLLQAVDGSEGLGLHAATAALVRERLRQWPEVCAVDSIGGANAAILQAFAQAGVLPDLSAVHFIARAITPPRRPRRFDSRFFAADISAVARRFEGVVGPQAELVELVWLPITEARRLDIPAITAVALDELQDRIATGMSHDHPVPFYRMLHKRFVREML